MFKQILFNFKFKKIPIIFTKIFFIVLLSKCYAQEKPILIKVLSYNVHYGVGMDSKKDLVRIAEVIKRVNPDIVGLQEVSDSTMTAKYQIHET